MAHAMPLPATKPGSIFQKAFYAACNWLEKMRKRRNPYSSGIDRRNAILGKRHYLMPANRYDLAAE
jgi:hypothetical protein